MAQVKDLLEKLRREAGDAHGHYALGVVLLSRDLFAEALRALREAVRLAPGEARHHAALAYALERNEEPALPAAAESHRLASEDPLFETYWLTLLIEAAPESETSAPLEAAAARQGIDLPKLRRELVEAGFPVTPKNLLINGFPHARNFMASWLHDEASRVEERLDPRALSRRKAAEKRELARCQRELRESVREDRVPAEFRPLIPWAQKLGIGDDRVRTRAFAALPPQELAEVRSQVEPFASAVHAWLDGFDPAGMPPEAAALMDLLLGLEER